MSLLMDTQTNRFWARVDFLATGEIALYIPEECELPIRVLVSRGGRSTEYEPSNSEIPNNSTISKMEQVETMSCQECKHFHENAVMYLDQCDFCFKDCKYEPTTQTETQNSNLTFKTLEYCDICDHKGCKECIANALDEHCIPSQFNKQIEDECAKEYEELGLKELKELIEADRKTEPTISKMEQVEEPQMGDAKPIPLSNRVTHIKPEPQTDCAWR